MNKQHKHISLEVAIIAVVSTGAHRLIEGDLIGALLILIGVALDWIKHKRFPWR